MKTELRLGKVSLIFVSILTIFCSPLKAETAFSPKIDGIFKMELEARASSKAIEQNSPAMIMSTCISAAQLQVSKNLAMQLAQLAINNYQSRMDRERPDLKGMSVKLKKDCKEDFLKKIRFTTASSTYFEGEENGTCRVQFEIAAGYQGLAFNDAALKELEKCAITVNVRSLDSMFE